MTPTITQSDRQMAAEITVLAELREIILSGRMDEHINVQTIARARIAGENTFKPWRDILENELTTWFMEMPDDPYTALLKLIEWEREVALEPSVSEGAQKLVDESRIAGWNAAVEAAAEVAKWSAMVPPDGGCPTNEETAVADEAALRIRNLRIDQEGKDDGN